MSWLVWLIGGIGIAVFLAAGTIIIGIRQIDKLHKDLEDLHDLEDEE